VTRCLVTGVAGFVGSHLAETLLAQGHDVVGVDCFTDYYPRPIKEANLRGALAHPRFVFHEADLRTAPLEPILEGVDWVVNEAAFAGLQRSWSDFDSYVTCNVQALQRLLDGARHAGVSRFVQASTSSVYGLQAVGDETQPTRPASPYGVTKLAAEHLILAHLDSYGFPAVILRYFSIFGPRQRPDMGYHLFIEAMLDGRTITVFGDGEQSRSNTYVDDAVAGTIAALQQGAVGEVYNIGGGEPITVNEAIVVLAETLGVEPRVERGEPRRGDQRHTMADTSKARAAFGYEPRVSPKEGLARQAAWQRAARLG